MKLAAVEQLQVFLVRLSRLLQLALEFELVLKLGDQWLFGARGIQLVVAVHLHLRFSETAGLRQNQGHVVQNGGMIGTDRFRLGELLERRSVVFHVEKLLSKKRGLLELRSEEHTSELQSRL